jgi:hypothetical protein
MSARFGANATSYLSRTTDLPGATPLTVCWRTQLVTDRNAAGMLWTLINSGLNTYEDVRLLTDGTTPRLGTNAANTSASSGKMAVAAAEAKAETLQYGPLYGLDDLRTGDLENSLRQYYDIDRIALLLAPYPDTQDALKSLLDNFNFDALGGEISARLRASSSGQA